MENAVIYFELVFLLVLIVLFFKLIYDQFAYKFILACKRIVKNIVMMFYLETKPDEVAVVKNVFSGKSRVIRDNGFIFPGSEVKIVPIGIIKDTFETKVIFKDLDSNNVLINTKRRLLATNEDSIINYANLEEVKKNVEAEKINMLLRQYFSTVTFKEVNRIKLTEIIGEEFNSDFELSVTIDFAYLPDNLLR